LNNIADSTLLADPSCPLDSTTLAEVAFSPRYLDAFYTILASESTSLVTQEQKNLVSCLISRLCREERDQNALANSGVLDALATMLASFVVSRGEVVPDAEILGRDDGMADMIPKPAARGASLTITLEAISAVIADSRFRASKLLYSPAIMAVFPNAEFPAPASAHSSARNALEMAGLSSLRPKDPGAMDYLLPTIPIPQSKSLSSFATQFPPLGSSLSRESLKPNGRSFLAKFSGWDPTQFEPCNPDGEAEPEEAESPLIPWLVHLIRSSSGIERIMAASVLASLYKAGLANAEREAGIGILVVPRLCDMIKERDSAAPESTSTFVDQATALEWTMMERTPAILARLIADSEYLQKSAHECGAVKKICQLLKDSYEPPPPQSVPRPWSPTPDRDMGRDHGLSGSRMGQPGQHPLCAHRIRMRESALKAIAAMASLKEEYRKDFVEQDIVPYIVESLSPSPSKPRDVKDQSKADKAADDAGQGGRNSPYGNNPMAVIISACHTIRMLSRSVSVLRTSLEDHGVAMPVLQLSRHPELDVQIAACGALCNLVTEFSPMREVSDSVPSSARLEPGN
jgi:hypothetical protein